MILKSLYLKNFRTYKGPEEISFANGEKNITIIQGNNEVGKTTIMNAITWCLYGVEYYREEGNEPIYNKNSSYELEIGEEDSVVVKLKMIDSKEKEILFSRSLVFYKNDSGDCYPSDRESTIYVDGVPVTEPNSFLSKHLPKDIREYFLFDGEQLESYFGEDRNQGKIKKSVYKLSQLDLLENIRNHLGYRINEYADELKKLNPSLGRYLKKSEKLKGNINEAKKELDEIEKNIKSWNSKVEENDEKIKKFGDDPSKLINRKKKLNKDLEIKDKRIVKKEEEYINFLTHNFPKILSINSIFDVKEITNDLEEKGFIPARFKKEFLKYLLDTRECICGEDLFENEDAFLRIQKLYDETSETTNIADTVNLLLGSINSIISNFPIDFSDRLIDFKKTIHNLNDERTRISKEILDIENLLSDDDEDRIKNLNNSNLEYNTLIKKNIERKGKLKNMLENWKKELSDIQKEIIKEQEKANTKSDLEESINFCEVTRDEIDKIYEELKEDMHNKLQKLTSEEFEKMHWKEFYNGVSIDEDYNVTIHKQEGNIVPHDLSKGGQLVLALSFMTALNSLSGFELPIIIDTPLGRLDEPIKENIGSYLPIYTRNKQVTLLVTSSEYSDGFKKGIGKYIGKEYKLKYIQETDGITKIENIV